MAVFFYFVSLNNKLVLISYIVPYHSYGAKAICVRLWINLSTTAFFP